MGSTERTRKYVEDKGEIRLDKYADGSEGARVRMMLRGDSLPVRSNRVVQWRYGEDQDCVCGERETEEHVLFGCQLYEDMRAEWKEMWRREKGEIDMLEGVVGFCKMSDKLDRVVLKAVGNIWRERGKREKGRE